MLEIMFKEEIMFGEEICEIVGMAIDTLRTRRERERMGLDKIVFKLGKRLVCKRKDFDKWSEDRRRRYLYGEI